MALPAAIMPKAVAKRPRCGAIAGDGSTEHRGPQMTTSESTTEDHVVPAAGSQEFGRTARLEDGAKSRDSVSARWREVLSTKMELAGLGALTAGVWWVRPWTGLIVLGWA
jgi:hypothetical protein